jgi:hypothetical protein
MAYSGVKFTFNFDLSKIYEMVIIEGWNLRALAVVSC